MEELTKKTKGTVMPTTRTRPSLESIFSPLDDLVNMWYERPTTTNDIMNNMSTQETDDSYIIHLQAVGIDKENIEISLDEQTVMISGETTDNDYIKNSIYYEFTLPNYVDADNITAKHENGILKLMAPKIESKADESTKRRIQIE